MADNVKAVFTREQIADENKWDLTYLFKTPQAWDAEFKKWENMISGYTRFQGKLRESVDTLLACLKFYEKMSRMAERLGTYAFLCYAEDGANSENTGRRAKFIGAASRDGQASSFISPEILAIPTSTLKSFISDIKLKKYKLWLERLMEEKKHTLGAKEEKLLAMQAQMFETASNVYEQLTDTDMKFGIVRDHKGQKIELSHASFSALMHGPNRAVRRNAFMQYYEVYNQHKHTISATLAGSVHADVFYARAKNFPSALESVLFSERVPVTVYDNLISTVREYLPSLHKYYDVRRRKMKLQDIHMYDTYVPFNAKAEVCYPWDQAVEMVLDAVKPLGDEYRNVLTQGLTVQRWCDRYENRGKHSGAFSCGSYDGLPYILMNYQENVLDHVFTLAHEAGHSMHSYFSTKKQPYMYHDYQLFVAEVASTFNEQLLHHYLMQNVTNNTQRLMLVNRLLDELRGTLFRQTMFAEFERTIHAAAEAGEAITLDFFTSEYRKLLQDYFGPDFTLDEQLSLECLRIPHFYRAFYVYKYATGISAAIALSNGVLNGGKKELDAYLKFLSGGCSETPLDLLLHAGVDMRKPQAIMQALQLFESLVNELE